jgi:hypothetical protein
MYIELKPDDVTGPGRIGRVSFSRSGKSLYYGGKTFQSLNGAGSKSSYVDVDSGDRYWISGWKRDGSDRLHGLSVPVEIDDDVREEYWTEIRGLPERKHETVANR